MEELIKLQLTNLYDQRGALINQLTRLDENGINFTTATMQLNQALIQIDAEINNAMIRAEKVLVVNEGKPA